MPKSQLSLERLHQLLEYEELSGVFWWKEDRNGGAKAGDIAGHVGKDGYVRIKIDGRLYKAHRLAWLYIYGFLPPEVDHEDTCKTNNSISNLRLATRSQSTMNSNVRNDNRLGVKGVVYEDKKKLYRAYINIDGKRKWLGRYKSIDKAIASRQKAAKALFGEFYRG